MGARKLRRLQKDEHRYINISGKSIIAKPKNYKKWKQSRNYKKGMWTYKDEELQEIKEFYIKSVEKRKATIKQKRKRIAEGIKAAEPGYDVARGMQKEIKKRKLMWRVTVGLNYNLKHKYSSYKIVTWALNKEDLQDKEDELVDKCIKGLEKELGFKKDEWWVVEDGYFTGKPNIAYQEVPFNYNLIDTEEEKKEFNFGRNSETFKKLLELRKKNRAFDSPDWN